MYKVNIMSIEVYCMIHKTDYICAIESYKIPWLAFVVSCCIGRQALYLSGEPFPATRAITVLRQVGPGNHRGPVIVGP